MTTQNEFAAELDQAPANSTLFDEAFNVLKEFCEGVEEYARAHKKRIRCYLNPGYSVNMGQEFQITVESDRGLTLVLFRAYIVKKGFPVTLNLYDDKLHRSDDKIELRKRLRKFIRRPGTRAAIDAYSS